MRILVVESDPITALTVQTVVLDLGQRPLCPVGTMGEIERVAAEMRVDAALIDVGEGDEERLRFGYRLSAQNIPVIYSTTLPLGERCAGMPDHACVLHKPYWSPEIYKVLSQLIDKHKGFVHTAAPHGQALSTCMNSRQRIG